MPMPDSAIAAVTHRDPTPYYLALLERPSMHWDASLGVWIAARADAVTAVLTHPACGVRPSDEPVPRGLVGTPAGRIFAELVRMTDGAGHAARKPTVSAALGSLDLAMLERASRMWAARLGPEQLDCLAVYVLAGALGVPDEVLGDVGRWTRDLVRCFAAGDGTGNASAAAAGLLAVLGDANAVGYLVQAYDATAGLIGNTLIARARRGGEPIADLVRWVVRHDPPVHNTRRYTAADVTILGQHIPMGEVILVVLAAANLDPAAECPFTFGIGSHACPGARLATTIATAGAGALSEVGLDLSEITYRPFPNLRVPQLSRQRLP
jgi:cytochrome P450